MTVPDLPAGFDLVAFDAVGSTNDEAKRLASEGAADGTFVWARRQHQGRGRRGRLWASPEGNLYCSVILRPRCPTPLVSQLSFVAAVAVAETVLEQVPQVVSVQVKWPNDILVGRRKAAGLLLEAEPDRRGGIGWVILGVGINIQYYPPDAEFAATSLVAAGGGTVTPEQLLERLAFQFGKWRKRWSEDGFGPIRMAWLDRARGLGEAITVRLPDRTLEGKFVDLDGDGALLLDVPEGGLRKITAGDVFFGPAS